MFLALLLAPSAVAARTVDGRHIVGKLLLPWGTPLDVPDPTGSPQYGAVQPGEAGGPFSFSVQTALPLRDTPACANPADRCGPTDLWFIKSSTLNPQVRFSTWDSVTGTVPAGVDTWYVQAGSGVLVSWSLTFG